MTQFQLKKVSANDSLIKFHVINQSDGSICGSVNVAPSEESDLLKHWRGAHAPESPAGTAAAARTGVRLKPLPRMSRQAILRGC
jgi:hypothetical protein